MEQRPHDGGGKAIGANPVEEGIAPTSRHGRLRHARHFRGAGKGRGNRPNGAETPITAHAAHARLLDINNVRPQRFQHVIAQAQALQHARREALGHHIGLRDQSAGDLQPLGVADIERHAALAGILVVELPAHIGIGHALQRACCRPARRTPAHR